jgi:predicted DNA-binding protein
MSFVIKLDNESKKRLTALAKKLHRSANSIAQEAIENYVELLEGYSLDKIVRENPGQIYTIEEVERMCNLKD